MLPSKLFFALLGRHAFFFIFHLVEEGKGEEEGGGNGGRVLTIRESSWCDTLVVMKILL